MTDLWTEASEDHEALTRHAALARADAELEAVMPFLLAARSPQEYAHRSALAQESIRSIAAVCGLDEGELMAVAQRRYELLRQALQEGVDPVAEVAGLSENGSGYGSGAAKPYGHEEGPDFSGDYAEVPLGAPGGPNPGVTAPRPPRVGPVQEPTASLRRATGGDQFLPMPPDTGTGSGSVDMGTPTRALDGLAPSLPSGGAGNGSNAPLTPPSIGQATSARMDPVRRRVTAVAAVVRETNPQLPQAECERVARLVVGRYLRQADLAGSAVNDEPTGDGGGSSGGSGGGGHSGMSGLEEYGLGRAIVSAAPDLLAAL